MGLDLKPSMRPHDAHTEEFWALWTDWMIEAGLRPGKVEAPKARGFVARLFGAKPPVLLSQDARAQRMFEISVPAYTLVGAPVVGQDTQADVWVTERGGPDAVQKHKGHHVLELVERCDGVPVYSNGGMGHVDLTSFRGTFLNECKDVIDEFDIMLAWGAMTPPELLAWGGDLTRAAKQYADQHGVGDVIGQRQSPDGDSPHATAAHIADSCGRWALWWSSRGHGMEPDF